MASITKRTWADGSVTYLCRVRTKGHKCVTKTCETKKEAKDWAQEIEIAQRRGEHFETTERNKTLKEAFEAYDLEVLRENESLAYSSRSRLLWWVEKLGDAYLSTITIPRVVKLRKELVTGSTRNGIRSNATVNRYVTNLSALLSYSVQHGWLPRNPIIGISQLEESKARDFALSEEQFRGLLEACRIDDELHLLVLIAKETAARRGEILKLRREDISFEKGRITFRFTKNGEIRSSYPSQMVFDLLKAQIRKVARLDGRVFVSPVKGGRIEKLWKEAREKAGLADFRFHDLRHTATTLMADTGVSLVELMQFTGHKSPSMVKRYSHLTEHRLAENQKRMRGES